MPRRKLPPPKAQTVDWDELDLDEGDHTPIPDDDGSVTLHAPQQPPEKKRATKKGNAGR
jgi:hypothetical protein